MADQAKEPTPGEPENQAPPPVPSQPGASGATDWQARHANQVQVNRDLEAKLNQFRDGLKSALGVEDKKTDTADLIAGLQGELAAFKHNAAVDAAARRHAITDDADIELLRGQPTEAAVEALAARLAAQQPDDEGRVQGRPRTPRPDPSQGTQGVPPALNSDVLEGALKSKLGIR